MVDALANFSPFQRTETLGVRVRDQLRHAIMAGLFRPGEKLTLRAVAGSLGVSLTPAREALFNLAAEGVLELGGNGSIYIPRLDEEKITELVKIRSSLESLATRQAMPNLTREDIIQISAINDRLIEANREKNYTLLTELNWSFHFTIYEAAKMPFLVKMIESCWLRTGSYIKMIYPSFSQTDDGILNHIAIIRAIREGDGEAAAEAVAHDIAFSSQAFYAAIREED
ncbi:GntR family transcriptional regulator [Ancylobacter sp. Lp-2]|uniref:GntR family transcriptional regulator n=1 Tax=Ancylobacter sp. Lp-2 TaxID=2881339 RepID=UPI001E3F5520|nr:GntR family transcriptional regulator [Ancylobacter sp. Lp-2]MCB4769679.1 GntR family transcriptional regulator [Ancylobacter sp. Lp-2]